MKQAMICGAILAAMAAAPACAQEAAYNYVQGSLGFSVGGETELDVVGLGSADQDLKTGLFAAVAGGRSFGNGLAVETEALYLKNDVDSDDLDALIGASTDPSVRSLGLLVNVTYTLPIDWQVKPFVGAGGGVGKTKYEVLGESDSATGFMWQVMAGVAFPVDENLTIDARYRYIRSPQQNYTVPVGLVTYTTEVETSAHILAVTARYKF